VYVNNAQIQKVLELHLHKVYSTQSRPSISSARGLDELVLSSRATEMQEIKQAVSSLPDMRANIVQDIRSKVSSGTYEINGRDIAESMFDLAINARR